ncbi:MAG: tetratricopeptide repeat protein [Pyrinomonadaceae bacterium]|nr:tetratricopeptide repeat protein [Pyrinomonadaceae bacterium]
MSFDKVKAMRNAERFLAQGKIRAAISEYKSIIESDPADYNTMNILGDLFAKASDENEAIKCFNQVAEHYTKQGFSQKAIAIYNKISRLKPDSLEVSSKLAQLYQSKGSIAEAKTHYTTMAEQYARIGKKAEALMVWKQIANLDPNNTDIYLKIADACWQDNQKNEAAQAYIEAGNRLVIKKQYESAITAFSRALEIRPEDMGAMRGFIESQVNLGYVDEAAKSLEESIEKQPYNRELLYLLIDCYLEMDRVMDAEKITVRLVEQEPSNYPRLIDLVKVYLKKSDLVSAVRPLSMASEHLLVGGQHVLLEGYINEILNKDSEQIDALRLLVRFHTWQRDESKIKSSYERLAEAARVNNSIDDEKNALSQLIMISPQNTYYAQRLHELNSSENGYQNTYSEIPTFESYQNLTDEEPFNNVSPNNYSEFETNQSYSNGNGNGNGFYHEENQSNFQIQNSKFDANGTFETIVEQGVIIKDEEDSDYSNQIYASVKEEFDEFVQFSPKQLSEFEKHSLQQELEGIEFYVAQGFKDLAFKKLLDLEETYGKQNEIEEARKILNSVSLSTTTEEENPLIERNEFPKVEAAQSFEETLPNNFERFEELQTTNTFSEPIVQNEKIENQIENKTLNEFEPPKSEIAKPSDHLLDDIKTEFGIEEKGETEMELQDFETPYQTGIAYKEMGLYEDSIREFQIAVKMTTSDDGTRKFYACCNMLGLCFVEMKMPNLALIWFKRALETKNLTDEELQGLYYEIADAYEQGGDKQKALENFEKIYAFDVSYRDVGERLARLMSN